MHIRPATLRDLPAILQLNLGLFLFEHQFTDSYSLAWTYSPVGEEYFHRRLTKPNGIVLIAEQSGTLVGYVCGYLYRFTARKKAHMAEIENMFIEPHWRRKKVGKALIDAFIKEAKRRGGARLKVGALAGNTAAHQFYRHSGFREHEVIFELDLETISPAQTSG